MLIISVRDNENNRWRGIAKKNQTKQNKTNKQREKRARENRSYSEKVRAKWFCCAFKLGFLQFICKVSLIFKSNLELALSIVWVKACCGGVWMFKNMRFVILFNMLLNSSFKMTKGLAKIPRTTASRSRFIY